MEQPFSQHGKMPFGATPWQIIAKVLLPEARGGIFTALTITIVTLVSYSAMAGAVGGGGLGDLGIRYGYNRFNPTIMLITVVILVVMTYAAAGLSLLAACSTTSLDEPGRAPVTDRSSRGAARPHAEGDGSGR